MTKKHILIAGGLVVLSLAVVLLLVLRLLLNPDALKPELEDQVHRLTGLQLELQGDIHLAFFPWLAIEFGPASLSSPEGFSEKMISVQHLSLQTKLLPLLHGKIDAKSLQVEGLDLNVVRNADGRWNFQLLPVKDVRVHKDEVIVDTVQGDSYAFSYLIKGLEVSDASVSVIDRMHGQNYGVRNCTISAEDVISGQPFGAEIAFDGSSTQPQMKGSVQLRGMVSMFPEALRFQFKDVKLNAELEARGMPFAKAGLDLSMDAEIQAEQGLFNLTQLEADAVVDGGIFAKESQAFLQGTGSLNLEQGVASAHLTRLSGLGVESEITASATDVLQNPQLKAQVRTNTFDIKNLLASCSIRPRWMEHIKGFSSCSYDGQVYLDKKSFKIDSNALHIGDAGLQVHAAVTLPKMRGFDVDIAGTRFDLCKVLPHKDISDDTSGASVSKPGADKQKRKVSAGEPFSLQDYQGKLRVDFKDLVCGKESIGSLKLDSSLSKGQLEVSALQLNMRHSTLTGAVEAHFPKTGYEPDAGKARISLRSENLRHALTYLGYDVGVTQDPNVWGKARVDLEAAFNPDGYALHAPDIELDGGTYALQALAAKPFPSRISLDIKGGVLDLNRYRPAKKDKDSGKEGTKGAKEKSGKEHKDADASDSQKSISLPEFVRKTHLSAKVAFEKLSYDAFTVGKLRAKAVSDQGAISVSQLQGTLFDGQVASSGSVDLRRTPAPLAVKLSAKGMDLEAFLNALGQHPHVSGRADMQADVTSQGLDTKEFFAHLSGNGSGVIRNGVIHGLNLSSAALTSKQGVVGPKAKTLFQKATVKANAKNGVVHFTQFDISYPPNTVNGTGSISLKENTISAELDANLQGLPVLPVTISGSLKKPDIGLNGTALVGNVMDGAVNVVKDILKSPLSIEQGIQNGIESLFSSKKKK